MERLVADQITVREAAQLLNLCERQVKRLKKEVKLNGLAALAHKNRGRKPRHAVTDELRSKVIAAATGEFSGASCQQMAELLEQYKEVVVSRRTISRILVAARIPVAFPHRAARRRKSRDRMPAEGLLVQCDASPFAWFEDRAPKASLHGIIDDATGKILGLHFRPNEDLHGYLEVLRQMVRRHGLPEAIYTDRHSIFFVPQDVKLTIEDELAGRTKRLTNFGQALADLGIRHIAARSPQAKGRVERLWGTLQSRLTIELRIAGVSDMRTANAFLKPFVKRFNDRFSVQPRDPVSAFRPSPALSVLEQAVAVKETRTVTNGSSFSYMNGLYVLASESGTTVPLRPGDKVLVLKHLNGRLTGLHKGLSYRLKAIAAPRPAPTQAEAAPPKPQAPRKPPAHDTPWRSFRLPGSHHFDTPGVTFSQSR